MGALLGGGYHLVAAVASSSTSSPRLPGVPPPPTPTQLAAKGGAAALRLSLVFGGYSFIRGGIKSLVNSDALACMGAGGTAVALPILLDPSRRATLGQYFSKTLSLGKAPPPFHLLVVSSFASGAFIVGGIDLALIKGLGVRW